MINLKLFISSLTKAICVLTRYFWLLSLFFNELLVTCNIFSEIWGHFSIRKHFVGKQLSQLFSFGLWEWNGCSSWALSVLKCPNYQMNFFWSAQLRVRIFSVLYLQCMWPLLLHCCHNLFLPKVCVGMQIYWLLKSHMTSHPTTLFCLFFCKVSFF